MSDAPERIWVWPDGSNKPSWYSGGCSYEVNLGLMGLQAEQQTEYVRADLLEAAVAAEREACAQLAEPKSKRPCDCETCYCGNPGDTKEVAEWDNEAATARAIRARSET